MKKRSQEGVLAAATNVAALGVAGVAGLGAVALHSWAIAGVGLVTYGALFAWELATKKEKGRRDDRGVSDKPIADPATRSALEAVDKARREIASALEEAPSDIAQSLLGIRLASDEMHDKAARLAHAADEISEFLRTAHPGALAQDLASLDQRIAGTRDEETRAQYKSARMARAEHLDTLQELSRARERTYASLLSIAATMQGIPSKIVRVRTLDRQAADLAYGDVREELERMNQEMAGFEETLRELVPSSRIAEAKLGGPG